MLIDLNDFRTKNESFEHFFLKQVARAYLFEKGVRCIATEVDIFGQDVPPFGIPKHVIDVLGVDRRRRTDELAWKIYEDIDKEALKIGQQRGLTEEGFKGNIRWKYPFYVKNKREQLILEKSIDQCMEEACEKMGYYKDVYKKLKREYHEVYKLYGVEVKVSVSDFHNGFSMCPDYTYIIAPKGIIPLEELPKKIGLLEFDFEQYYDTGDWKSSLKNVKSAKKQYDSRFLKIKGEQSSVDKIEHAQFCYDKLAEIAQQNTEEHIFWNPWIRQMKQGYQKDEFDYAFKFNIGQKIPMGIVVDRKKANRMVKKTYRGKEHKEHKWSEYYKLAIEGVGLSDWMLYEDIIEKSMIFKTSNTTKEWENIKKCSLEDLID